MVFHRTSKCGQPEICVPLLVYVDISLYCFLFKVVSAYFRKHLKLKRKKKCHMLHVDFYQALKTKVRLIIFSVRHDFFFKNYFEICFCVIRKSLAFVWTKWCHLLTQDMTILHSSVLFNFQFSLSFRWNANFEIRETAYMFSESL